MSGTPNLNLAYLLAGQLQPEVTVNADLNTLDSVLAGVGIVALTNANVTLTTAQAQNRILRLQGTLTANVTVSLPASLALAWVVSNETSGAYTVTLQVTGGTSSVAVAQGSAIIAYSNGTNLNYATVGVIPQVTSYLGPWNRATNYQVGNQVTYGGNYYEAVALNVGQQPPNASYWVLIGPATLDNLGDGTTYYRMPGANMDGNRRGLIDFTQAGHLYKNLDNIEDGPSGRTAQHRYALTANNGDSSNWVHVGTLVLANGHSARLDYSSGSGYNTGANTQAHTAIVVRASNGGTVPNLAGVSYIESSNRVSVMGVALVATGGSTAPANTSWEVYFELGSYNIGVLTVDLMPGDSFTLVDAIGTNPGAPSSTVVVANGGQFFNPTAGAGLDGLYDGTTYARVSALDSTPVSGANRIKLGVAGSGAQIGDQRNLLPILSAGAQAVWQNLSITYTAAAGSPATATISVSAAQILGLQNAGATVDYNASSANVTGTGGTVPTYFLYYIDPGYSGGTQTLYATTTSNDLRQQLGIVYIGTVSVTYPTSGTGSGTGDGGLCVADAMWVAAGLRAGDAAPGDLFDCVDLPTGQGKHVRQLLGATRGVEECVRIVTEHGAALVCSISTPFDTPDGRELRAPEMLGEQVLTDRGVERVVSITPVGKLPVSRIHLGGVSYAAGEDPAHRIYSHNTVSKP